MKISKVYAGLLLSVLVMSGTGVRAGVFSSTNFPSGAMNDSNVGLSTNHNFVIAADVIGTANTTINGVLFTSSGAVPYGTNWSLVGVGNQYTGNGNLGNVTGQLTNLMVRFQYGGNPGTMILSNLVAGTVYEVTYYSETWGGPRTQLITASGGGSTYFDPDLGGGSLLRYSFVATNATESITFNVANNNNNASFHFYGFSERQVFNNQWNVAGGGSFNDPVNWTRLDAGTAFGAPVAVGLSAMFSTQAAPTTVTIDANSTAGHLQFDGANAYTLTTTNGSSLTLQADPGGVSVLNVIAGTHSISVPITLASDLVKSGSGEAILYANISGASGLNVQKGTISLAGTNGYGGATVVSGGSLNVQNSTALPSTTILSVSAPGTVVLSNGVNATVAALFINGNSQLPGTWGATGSGAARINDSVFSGPGTITVLAGLPTASGSWSLNGNGGWGVTNNWVGGVIAQGTNATAYFTNAITADRVVTNPYSPLDIGNLTFVATNFNWIVTNGSMNFAVSAGVPTISVSTNRATIYSTLSGASGLLKTGPGALVLGANNNYSGGTTINNGSMQLGVNSTAGWIGGDVVDGGRLIFARTDTNIFGGAISGTGSVVQAGAGMTILTNVNSYSGGTVATAGKLGISQDANIGGAATALSISGAVLQITGTAIQNLNTHSMNWGTFNGGFDIASAANTFTITSAIGNVSAAGSFAKFGAGSLVISNAWVNQQIMLFQQGSNFIESGSVVTALNYLSVGQIVTTAATMTVRGNGRLASVGDFNVSDLTGTTGILTVADSGAVVARTMFIGKSGNAVGILKLAGGSVVSSGTTDWRIGGGLSTNDRASYGYVRQTGGNFFHAQNMQIGAFGIGQWDLLGGTLTNTAGAPVVARYPGSIATFNINGGRYVSTGWGFLCGEQGDGVLTVANGTMDTAGGGNGFAIGGWSGNGDQGTGTVNLATGGLIIPRFIKKGNGTNGLASVAILNFDGGTVRAATGGGTFMQGLDLATIWSGGATFDSDVYNITVAQPLLAPAGSGLASVTLTNGGAGYIGPPVVRIMGGGGTGATAYAQIDTAAGTVTNIVVTSPGVNYSSLPAVVFSGGGAGAGATVSLAANATGGGLTKQGSGSLTLAATNTYGGNTTIGNGVILVGNTNALGAGTITLATNAVGIGTSYAMDQNFLNWLTGRLAISSSPGVLALGANTTNTLDLSAFGGWMFGAAGGAYNFEGSLLNTGTNLYLGGGNGTLTYVPTIGTGTNVFIGQPGGNTAGIVVLSGTNDAYASEINVRSGTLRGGRANAIGSATAVVNVASGAVLDIGGQTLGAVPVNVAGSGIGGAGAIVNSGAQQINALQNVRLTGDATFGGPNNRWDLRGGPPSLDLAGFSLSKTGANYIAVVGGNISDGNISIVQGTFSIEAGCTVSANVGRVYIQPGATLNFYGSPSPVMLRPISCSGGSIQIGGGSNCEIGSPITLAGGTNTINTAGFNLVLTGLVDGAGALLKINAGILTLSTPAAYTGQTIVSGGILELAASNALSGTIGSSSGILISNAIVNVDLSNGFNGSNTGAVVVTTSGLLTESNGVANSISGPLTLAGSVLNGGTPDALLGNWSLGGNVSASGYSTIAAPRTQLAKAGGVTFDVATGATLFVSSTLEDPALGANGTGTLIKAGAGTMIIGVSNNYGGATIISNGSLRFGIVAPTGAVARWMLNGNANDSTGNGHNGTITGAGSSYVAGRFGQALNVTGSQYVQVPYDAAFVLSNFTVSAWIYMTVNPGTYGIVGTRFGSDNTFDMKYQAGKIHGDIGSGTNWLTTAADANYTLSLNAWHMISYSVTTTGYTIYADTAAVASGTFPTNTTASPLLMKAGQTMGIGSDYPGENLNGSIDDVNIYGRALIAAEIATLYNLGTPGTTNLLPVTSPLMLASGATFDLFGAQQQIGSLNGSGVVTNGSTISATLSVGNDNANTTFSGPIRDGAGSVALAKIGTGIQTLNGISTFSGGTAISGGSLIVNGALIGTGGVTFASGTLGGTGIVNGFVINMGGTVAPGASPGRLTILGDYATAGSLDIEIAGNVAGSGYDQLLVGGSASLGGTLNVTLTNYTPVAGDSFTILTASNGLNGTTFGAEILPTLSPPTLGWQVQYLPNTVVLSVTSAPTGYDAWAAQIVGTNTAYNQSALGDGYPNLLKYATGSSPTTPDNLANMNAARLDGILQLLFNHDTNATDISLIVEGAYTSTNDATWNGIATNIAGSWGSATNVVENTSTNPASVTVSDTAGPSTNRFLRLRVTRP